MKMKRTLDMPFVRISPGAFGKRPTGWSTHQ